MGVLPLICLKQGWEISDFSCVAAAENGFAVVSVPQELPKGKSTTAAVTKIII